MTPEQNAIVQATWRHLEPMADSAVRMFYDRLFEIDETTRQLFRAADSSEQRRKLIEALTIVVHGLDHVDTLGPGIEALGRRHLQYGVTHAHYDSVGRALLWMLENALGSGWTPEVRAAWSGAYALIAGIMRSHSFEP